MSCIFLLMTDQERDLELLERSHINQQLAIQEQIEAMVVHFRCILNKISVQTIQEAVQLPLGQEVMLWTEDELVTKKEEFSHLLTRLFVFRKRQVFSKSFELQVAKTKWQLCLSPALTTGETWSVVRNRLALTSVAGAEDDEKEKRMVQTTDTDWTWDLSYSQVTSLVGDKPKLQLAWAAGSSGSLVHPAKLLPTIDGTFNVSHLTCQTIPLPKLDHPVVHWVGHFPKSGLTDFTIGCWLSPKMMLLRGPNCETLIESDASFATPIALDGDKVYRSVCYPENFSVQPDGSRVLYSRSGKVTILRTKDLEEEKNSP